MGRTPQRPAALAIVEPSGDNGAMGPVDAPKTESGKLFAGLYALYAGLVFTVSAALVFTPVRHRVMHHFHWDEKV